MAFVVIELDVPTKDEYHLNDLVKTDAHAGVQELVNLLQSVLGGSDDASVKVAIRATTSTPTSSGNGVTAVTYNLK